MKDGISQRVFPCAALLLLTIQGQAQQSRRTLLRHIPSEVSSGQAQSVGVLPPAQHLNISIVLPLRNHAQLTGLLKRLYDPSSPDYHRFLNVAQFTEQFGPSPEDYAAVVNFARANGFTVTDAPENRMIVPIYGTVAQVEKAFHITMRNYSHPTEHRVFFAPDREPSLDLAAPVAHIAGLNNFSIPRSLAINAPLKKGPTTAAISGSGPGGSYLGSDMRAAYYGGTALTGIGEAVGLMEFDGYELSDVNLTFSNAGQSYSVPINNVLLDGATGAPCQFLNQCSDAEQVLDIAQAIGMAPGLSQVRVYIGNVDADILNSMASENIAHQLSISWTWTPDDPATDDIFFEEFAAQGQSLFAASGDAGDFDPLSDNYYPPEDSNLTAVGGTDLLTTHAGGRWRNETAWDLSGGGISPDGIAIPSWQTGIANSSNLGSTTLRNVPDVAMEANTDNYDCDMGVCSGTWGGTSFAAPRWAAFTALINQQAAAGGNPPLGFINPAIYAIGEGSSYSSDFHDITVGNNITGCCGNVFFAVPGYDLVTGWGSPSGQNLIDALAPPPAVGFYLSASSSSLTINPGSSGMTTITVNGQAGFNGSVDLAVSGLPTGVTASLAPNPTTGSSLLTLMVSNSAIRGSYLLTVIGTSGTLSATADIALEVNAPGFTILPSPGVLLIFPGTSGSTTVTVTDYAGFSGSVNFAVTSALPAGVTAYWTTDPTNGNSLLTLTASTSAAPVRTVITITGISGILTATTTVPLVVNFPSSTVVLSPVPNAMVQGSSATATATVVPFGNFTGPVTLLASQLPQGVTATFSPNPTTDISVLTLTASGSAPLGTFGASVADNIFALTITSAPTPNFTVGISPGFLTMTQGGAADATITVSELNGFTGNVSLQAFQLPSGVSATFGTNPTTGTSVLTLHASSSSAVGIFLVSVLGFSGTQGFGGYFYLTINPAPGFTLSATPVSLNLAQSSQATENVAVTPQVGFTGAVSLAVTSALPSGVNAQFSPNPTTGSSVLTLSANSSAPLGNYLAIIAGTSSGRTVTTTLPLVVTPAGTPTATLLSVAPTGGTLIAGTPYTLTAMVTPSSGPNVPSGNVVFTIGSVTQPVALNSSGVAIFASTAPEMSGSLVLSAAYQGTSEFSASTSNILSETITSAAAPTFTLGGTSVTLSPGATTGNTSTITVTPSGGFIGNIALTAAVTSSPTNARYPPTLSFGSSSPVSINGTNVGMAILTISTTAATSNALSYHMRRGALWYSTGGMTLAGIIFLGIPRRERDWRSRFGMSVLAIILSGGMLGCGGGGNSTSINNPGTTAGTYTVTVTGTSGTTTVMSTITVQVQ